MSPLWWDMDDLPVLQVSSETKRLVAWVILGGGFTYFLFSPLFGEDSHLD